MKSERIPNYKTHAPNVYEENADATYLGLLRKLPLELAEKHMAVVIEKDLNETEIESYLRDIINQREVVTTESFISDKLIQELCPNPKEQIFAHLETDVFASPNIGSGMTARVKRFELTLNDQVFPLAIKYLITPTSKTLSASAEHDMLCEVERMETVETIERGAALKHIAVPHPHFHHKTQRLQCYGMELIDGVNLNEVLTDSMTEEMRDSIRHALTQIPKKELLGEIKIFFNLMHSYCIHGDIKPRNIMIDRAGKLYVIDFGQSVLVSNIPEEGMSQLENLRDAEIDNTKTIINLVYTKLSL